MKRDLDQKYLFYGIAICLMCILCFMLEYSPLIAWENSLFKYKFLLRGERTIDDRIAVVELDEKTLSTFGYPIPRDQWAIAVKALTEWNAKVIGFDILFVDDNIQDQKSNLLLGYLSKQHPNVLYSAGFFGKYSDHLESSWNSYPWVYDSWDKVIHCKNILKPNPNIVKDLSNIVQIAIKINNYGSISSVPSMIEYEGSIYKTLGLEAFRRFTDTAENLYIDGNYVIVGSNKLRINHNGEFIINYPGKHNMISNVSLIDLLQVYSNREGDSLWYEYQEMFSDKIVLLGQTALGLGDYSVSPYEELFPNLYIHAFLLDNFLNDRLITRVSFPANFLIPSFLGFLSLFIWKLNHSYLRILLFLVIITISQFIYYLIFSEMNIWANSVLGLFACISSYSLGYIEKSISNERLKNEIQSTFKQYMSPAIYEYLIDNPHYIPAKRREVSILFSDIVAFSTFADTVDPELVIVQLEEYFTEMVRVVFGRKGTLDKFMGDGMLVFFGDPIPSDDYASTAIKTAMDMQRHASELSKKWENEGKYKFLIRIGISTGYVTVGSFGSDLYSEYTVLGKNVNLAQRLESICSPGHIFVCERTRNLSQNDFVFEYIGEKNLKGHSQPRKVYVVKNYISGTCP